MSEEFINPKEIKADELPLIVFSDHTSGALQWAIKWWTKGHYNHVMWMHKPGMVASQGNLFSEESIDKYMKRGNRLKFVKVVGLRPEQRKMILASIRRKLNQPWWQRLYDWPGVLIGQGLKQRWFGLPTLEYCSEDVPAHLRDNTELMSTMNPDQEQLKRVLMALPKHGAPEDLNQYQKETQPHFKVVGRWDSDAE